jgi:hypothetical protein
LVKSMHERKKEEKIIFELCRAIDLMFTKKIIKFSAGAALKNTVCFVLEINTALSNFPFYLVAVIRRKTRVWRIRTN